MTISKKTGDAAPASHFPPNCASTFQIARILDMNSRWPMSGIITICGRRFECVPGENLLREIKPGSKSSTVSSSLDNRSETSTERKAFLSLTSLLADFDGSPLRLLASVAAFSTCFALLLAPPHLFRPVAATQEHVKASQSAENHWYSSGTSTNVSSNHRPSSAPETTSVVM